MDLNQLRNIAIIAHVDHGKTTLVDQMLKQSGVFGSHQAVRDRVMDSGDIERERGITILAKNTSILYGDYKINVVDTPGHADFGGEVERVLKMVSGVLLLVDAFEGTMPQTRFVLGKALELGHKVIVVVNKIDRPDARIESMEEEILQLLMDLGATDDQLYSPIIYCSARNGTASLSPGETGENLLPLFEKIVEYIPAPTGDSEKPLQMLVSAIDYNEYVGRIAIGRIENGTAKQNQEVTICQYGAPQQSYKSKITNLYTIEGLERVAVGEAHTGEIVCISGIENIHIGQTICAIGDELPLPFVKISEPTIEMIFSVNDSPFAGREGKFLTSRHLRDRLWKELLKDVSLRVEETDTSESFKVCGRGEMHLSILIETMRREGYEMQVGAPKVLFKEEDGRKTEPMERVFLDVPQEFTGSVMEKLGSRHGEMQAMELVGDRMKIEFVIPARGLFGYRSEFLTDTHGEGILNTSFEGYEPYKGEIAGRNKGSLISFETGEAVTYGLYNAQERGELFIDPGTHVYEGMIVGKCPKPEDLVVNVCKKKHVTNMRASGSDDALRLVPATRMSLEQCIEFIRDDELIEVTPLNLRLRKKILDKNLRAKAGKNK